MKGILRSISHGYVAAVSVSVNASVNLAFYLTVARDEYETVWVVVVVAKTFAESVTVSEVCVLDNIYL